MTTTYCTILATNYLPRALALADSLRRHHGASLHVLFIDVAERSGLPDVPGVQCLATDSLGLPRDEVLSLAAAYDLVELATAVKPVLLQRLLGQTEQVVYLDPDTWVVSPMAELEPALARSSGGLLLTPHFLHPAPTEGSFTDGHMLLCGVYNLGFCAVDRRAEAFLDWWWSRLRTECLYDPLSGIFYDQKWMDIGAVTFEAAVLRHAGYNVGVANLRERSLSVDGDGYRIVTTGEALRLFHFHAFDSSAPEQLSARFRHAGDELLDAVLLQLAKEYAAVLSGHEQRLPPAPAYPYAVDSAGRALGRHLRRAYREAWAAGSTPPSPFEAADAAAWARWRRRALATRTRGVVVDAAKSARIIAPDQYDRIARRFPAVREVLRRRFRVGSGLWG